MRYNVANKTALLPPKNSVPEIIDATTSPVYAGTTSAAPVRHAHQRQPEPHAPPAKSPHLTPTRDGMSARTPGGMNLAHPREDAFEFLVGALDEVVYPVEGVIHPSVDRKGDWCIEPAEPVRKVQ